LPEAVAQKLLRQTGRQPERDAPPEWLWHQRRVLVADGTTVTMPDTPANQQEYPQIPGQQAGCGFPIVRMVVLFSLAVGTAIEVALGQYAGQRTGENSLLRTLRDQLEPGDVLLLDRAYCSWFDLAGWRSHGVDAVVRKHQTRATDFRTGRRLGHDDHVVVWSKPKRPVWMTKEQYDALPHTLTLREVRVRVTPPGFRTQTIVVVTTLLDASTYSADAIAQLYRRRWAAELNLRSLKIVLQMDHLRCLTPQRVRNEIYLHLAAYNLIRGVMAAAAQAAGRAPWTVSFKGAMQALNNLLPLLPVMTPDEWCAQLVRMIAAFEVGDRPDRYEPRLKKRRPKTYKSLREPRQNYRTRMAT
jgi:putative transposase